MQTFDLTQPTPDDRHDEVVGYINELTDYVFNLETMLLFAISHLQRPYNGI